MITLAFFSNLAGPDLIIILLLVLVLFGAKKLPELAKGMGQAMKEFKKAKDDFSDEIQQTGTPAPATPRSAPAAVPRLAEAQAPVSPVPAPRETPAGQA
ncbi:MAG: twin-arginine translocase TatA/TatE family subunit [Chthoniobacterales bacterium]